ncbi:MAG: PVC-type heme-binding CxxCH protein [Phycisphaeraceae bacterium]
MKHTLAPTLLALALLAAPALAQRGLRDIPKPDPDRELKEFKVAAGMELKLFAATPMLASPIQMNFDAKGRLWIASSEVYPMIKPGQVANDKIIVLEDTDGDGQADKSTVFADGLLIPTAVMPDATGNACWVANSTEMLYLKDTDGDGKADEKRIVLSGFGTEDTHHILHTFRFGVDGFLYMNQSIYIHSHIETPWGVRRLNAGGIWHFRPDTMQLEVFCRGFVNTWGHQQDRWGQSFATDGAYGDGVNYTFPGATFVTAHNAKRTLKGLNPGQPKHCGLEILSGRHLPEDWSGTHITNDFRGNRVNRFVITEDGSGYAGKKVEDVLSSPNVAFRPVDVKMGGDGAIYIADWYNPIIQHGEVDFRDERRDHVNGRVWRISAKDRAPVKLPKIIGATADNLLPLLKEPEDFTRLHAKLQLREVASKSGDAAKEVESKLASWIASLDANDSQFEHHRLEGLWMYQTLNIVEPALLKAVLRSKDHRARAAATRVLYHWHDRVPDALALLSVQVEDEHPRVRLEAVNALRQLDSLPAAETAMKALDKPVDQWLDFAIWLTARETSPHWLSVVQEGKRVFGGNAGHLTFAIKAAESPQVVGSLVTMLKQGKIDAAQRGETFDMVAALGGPGELRFVLDEAIAKRNPGLLAEVLKATQQRNVKPAGDLSVITPVIDDKAAPMAITASRLAGAWKLEAARGKLTENFKNAKLPGNVRQAAADGLASLGGDASKATFSELASGDGDLGTRMMAAVALAAVDLNAGAARIADILVALPETANPAGVLNPMLSRAGGPQALAKALDGKKIKPDVAKIAMRTITGSPQQSPELLEAIMKAGDLSNPKRELSSEEMAAMMEEVGKKGNPARGEAIYRRDTLRCVACHAIGGSGGAVGPDMTSIGGSAPVDYLIESLLEPAKKVKEGYHAVQITTQDFEVLAGVPIRKNDKELVLRTSDDKEVTLLATNIASQREAPSLMPVGLTDGLTRAELVDLVSFLSRLGKTGEYAVGAQRFIRTWRTPIGTIQAADHFRHHGVDVAPKDSEAVIWSPVYTTVSGSLPWDDTTKMWMNGPRYGLLRSRLNVTTPGKVALKLSPRSEVKLWVGTNAVTVSETTLLDLPQGEHTLTFAILEGRNEPRFSAELVDVEGSPARAQVVGGK